jgi:4-amino-4-deoxy-L-arabinose transferase-like glycosyltransferase
VLPAFAIAYLLTASPPRWVTRLWHTLVAGAVCLAVSLSWVIIATLTPAADRPYIDGSTNNSAIAMVFGYNGLARFSSVGVSAAGTGSVAAAQGGNFGEASSGWFKLLEHNLASQVGWLYPVAAAGVLLGLWRRGRARTDQVRGGTLMWTGWLLMTGLALSAGNVPHSTYVVALAPPLAALSAYALVRTVAMYRSAQTRPEHLALPVLTAVTLAWAVYLSADFPNFVPGIALPLAALAVTIVAVAIVARRIGGGRRELVAWPAALCCALMLAIPAMWSLSVFDSKYAGSSGNANAGGYTGGMFHFPMTAAGAATAGHGARSAAGGHGGAGFNPFNPSTKLTAAQARLLAYLTDHRDGARYLVATESWSTATPYIIDDEASILPMGGFSGAAGFPQPQQFSAMVNTGEVRYVLLTGRGMHFPGMRAAPQPGKALPQAPTDLSKITATVTKHCHLVPASAYGAVPQETAPLYQCG